MKYYIIITLALLTACANPYFKSERQVCNDAQKPDKSYFPIDLDRKWEYRIEYSEEYKSDLSEKEISELPKLLVIELGESQKVFADKYKKSEIDAFPIIVDGNQNNYHYLIECGEGSTMIEVFNPFEPIIYATFPIFNSKSDTSYWDGISKNVNVYRGKKTFNTNKGRIETIQFETQVMREGIIAPNRQNLNPEIVKWKYSVSYYAEGIGPFMREIYDKDGMLIAKHILNPYTFDYDPSPINP